MSLVGKKFKLKNRDDVKHVEVVEERASEHLSALVTLKGNSKPEAELRTVRTTNLGDEVK